MREQADKFDNRNPENEGMGEDKQGFDLVAENLQGCFVTVREDQEILVIKHPELDNIEIVIHTAFDSGRFSIDGCKDKATEMFFTKPCPMSSCKNITPEVVQAWLTTLMFKLEN